jgi:hypothetical protein
MATSSLVISSAAAEVSAPGLEASVAPSSLQAAATRAKPTTATNAGRRFRLEWDRGCLDVFTGSSF